MKRFQKIQALGWLAIAAQLGFASVALSQENTSTATAGQSTWDAVKEKIKLQYIADFAGPSLTKPYHPDITGDMDLPMTLENRIGVGYRFNKRVATDFVFDFFYNPIGSTGKVDPTSNPIVVRDFYVRTVDTQFVRTGNFFISSEYRVYFPTSVASQAATLITGFRNNMYSSLAIPNSKWSVGHYSILRGNIFSGLGSGGGVFFQGDLHLHGEYQLTQSLSLTLWSQVFLPRFTHRQAWVFEPGDMEVGVNWDITPQISFNPYIRVLPGAVLTTTPAQSLLDTTAIAFNLTANIL